MQLVQKTLFFALSFSLISLYSCADTVPVETTNNNTAELSALDKKIELTQFVTSNTRNLRVRITPDLQGEVVEIVPQEGSLLEYLQDSTLYKTQIGQGKESIAAHWYKVLTPSGKEGWAYGAFITFKSASENKVIIAQKKADSIKLAKDPTAGKSLTATKRKKGDDIVNESIIQTYSNYIQKLSDQNINNVKLAAEELQRLVDNASSATADRAFMIFKNFFGRVENTVKRNTNVKQYLYLKEDIEHFGRINVTHIPQLNTLEENGFILAVVDDQVAIVQDIDFLARQFYRFVSPEMRQFLNQVQIESETHWRTQSKLLITPTQLAEWLVFWSNFADSNNKFVLYSNARQKANEYLSILLQGLPSTPAFDSNNQLNDIYKAAYERIIELTKDSTIGEIISSYYEVLMEYEFEFSNTIRSKQIEILKQ